MKCYQPLLLLIIVVFAQCTSSSPAQKIPDLFKADPAVIKEHHIRLSKYYEIKYDESGSTFNKKLVKTSYFDSTGKAVLIVRPVYAIDHYLTRQGMPDSLTGRFDSIFYSYDAGGRILKAVSHSYSGVEPRVETYTYAYDSWGNQVLRKVVREGMDSSIQRTSYVYGKNGRIQYSEEVWSGNAAGIRGKAPTRTEYVYDYKGNIVQQGKDTYKYNSAGQLTVAETSLQGFSVRGCHEYNEAGKCIRTVTLLLDPKTSVWDTTSYSKYTYDKRNLLLEGMEIEAESMKHLDGYAYEYE